MREEIVENPDFDETIAGLEFVGALIVLKVFDFAD